MSGVSDLYGAIDLGGTKILAAVATASGEWLGDDARPTDANRGPDAVIASMVESLRAAARHAGVDPSLLRGVGIGAPGPIDFARQTVVEMPNLPDWEGLPLAQRVGDALTIRAVLENDANAAAYGEHAFGAGQGVENLIYLTVSTGIGGGLVLGNHLYRGALGSAGELGHIVINEAGPLCGCGAHGCLEAMASGTAIAEQGVLAVRHGRSSTITRLAAGGAITAETVARAAQEGDNVAAEIIAAAGHALGLGLADFVNVFNPDLIVIGGGTAKIGAALLDPALATMRARAFRRPAEHVRIVPAALGDRSVAAGALALARELS